MLEGSDQKSPVRSHALRDSVALGILTLLLAGGVALLVGIRIPEVHDEFAYLLMGETFSSGRLTNPTPRFWEHLEGFHILLTPTYTAKYPPAQGLPLALGILLGHPIVGVWISAALMVAATTWMLHALLPRKWALMGGLLILCQLGIAGSWAQSYWGGATAATAGALVYGSLFRSKKAPTAGIGALMGVGLILLANSRPMEGFLVSLPALLYLVSSLWTDGPRRNRSLWLGLVPVLVLGFGAMGAYNAAVVGDPLRMPYQEYQAQYGAAPLFLTSSLEGELPSYRHPEFDQFWAEWERGRFLRLRQPEEFVRSRLIAVARILLSFVGMAALGLWYLRNTSTTWVKLSGAAIALGLSAVLLSKGAYPHYLAPAAPLFIFLATKGWMTGAKGAPNAAYRRMAFAAAVATLWMPVLLALLDQKAAPDAMQLQRVRTAACLGSLAYPSLVLVDHVGPFRHRGEWVRNGPDPWQSKIVWARAMDSTADELLIAAAPERAVWRATLDNSVPTSPEVTVRLQRPPVDASDASGGGEATACRLRT